MGFIGYSASGYNELEREIASRKSKITEMLANADTNITAAIKACWNGVDADKYMEELKKALNTAKSDVETAYSELSSSCLRTYQEWVAKQGGN